MSWLNRARAVVLALALVLLPSRVATAAELQALNEFSRPDPFGGVVAPDGAQDARSDTRGNFVRAAMLQAVRGGYASFHLVVKMPQPGPYVLSLSMDQGAAALQADLYREWFHFVDSDKRYYPDALVPLKLPYRSQIPEPDNRIPNQTAQAFWVDIWIPRQAQPGTYHGMATLQADGKASELPIEVKVLAATISDEDVITMDHNSYGSSWLAGDYPNLSRKRGDAFFRSDEFFRLIHAYHRIFYENHGVFHQLGYGHAGKVGPEYAPELEGSGRRRHISNWELYDRHYGPLFDGSAFSESRRGARPIPFVYLPINPEWPASFLNWGEPGYEAEFVNVVSEMERHFREKGWTRTHLEVFFNHKKRYMGFPWDGDEVRFPADNRYFLEYGRLLKKALPAGTPVKFVFRADASWDMEKQFGELAGVINMWVAAGDVLSWLPEAPEMLRHRGDIIWYYSGPPSVTSAAVTITRFPMRGWMWGVQGFVHWQTVDAGNDPWFHFNGGGTALVYPGERFGIEGPIPSVRLKIQRNCVQDLTLLDSFSHRKPIAELKSAAAGLYNHTTLADWWSPRPALANEPTSDWSGTALGEASHAAESHLEKLDPSAWQKVRQYILRLAAEEK